MTNDEARAVVAHGLYVLHWHGDGQAAAAVGSNEAGDRWFAPTNWTAVPSYDWSSVESAVLITTQRREQLAHDDQRQQQEIAVAGEKP